MKRLIALLVASLCMLCAASAFADGEIEAQQETAAVIELYGENEYFYVAFIKNVSGDPVLVRDASLALYNADGEELARTEYYREMGSYYLDPGEETVIMFELPLDGLDPKGIAEKKVTYTTEKNAPYGKDTAYPVASAEYIKNTSDNVFAGDVMTAMVTNEQKEEASGIGVCMVLVDKDEYPLLVRTVDMYNVFLQPGSTVRLEEDAEREVVDYFVSQGKEPAGIKCYGFQQAR